MFSLKLMMLDGRKCYHDRISCFYERDFCNITQIGWRPQHIWLSYLPKSTSIPSHCSWLMASSSDYEEMWQTNWTSVKPQILQRSVSIYNHIPIYCNNLCYLKMQKLIGSYWLCREVCMYGMFGFTVFVGYSIWTLKSLFRQYSCKRVFQQHICVSMWIPCKWLEVCDPKEAQ